MRLNGAIHDDAPLSVTSRCVPSVASRSVSGASTGSRTSGAFAPIRTWEPTACTTVGTPRMPPAHRRVLAAKAAEEHRTAVLATWLKGGCVAVVPRNHGPSAAQARQSSLPELPTARRAGVCPERRPAIGSLLYKQRPAPAAGAAGAVPPRRRSWLCVCLSARDTSARDTHRLLLWGDGRKDVNIIFLWRRDGHFPNFAWLSKGSKRDVGG